MFGSFLTFYTLASLLPLAPKTKENRAAPFKKPRAKAENHEKSSKMVGLSIVLEQEEEAPATEPHQRHHRWHGYATSEVINNSNMSMLISNNPGAGTRSPSSASTPSSPSPSPSPAFRLAFPAADFLNQCFLCRTKLSPGKDIYMYRGDRAFCSEECRCRQILLDEEEAFRRDNQNQSHCSSAAHPSSSRNRRGSRNSASSGGV